MKFFSEMTKKQKKLLLRILLSAALLLLGLFIRGELRLFPFAAAYLCAGYDVLRRAFRGILRGQAFDENFLMALATVGAIILGEYTEACAVMLLYQTGELFQSCAVGKSRRSIRALMDIRPDYANVEADSGELLRVDPEGVAVGSVIVVRPGERLPIDGVICTGESSLDLSPLTGESIPVRVSPGDEVHSGSVNLSSVLKLRTSKEFGDSTASRILELVENASSRKSRSENFISRFAAVYTPAVCLCALVLGLLPPVLRLCMGLPGQWSAWIYRALTFLVISCPCALVISIPLSFFAGLGGAGREGILIKGSNFLETLSKVRRVAFDKTGTLTRGVFEVSELHGDAELLEYAACAEYLSGHPISRSLREAYGKEVEPGRVRDFQELRGLGVTAAVDGAFVAAGSGKLMEQLGVAYEDCQKAGTVVHVSRDGEYLGYLLISDRIRDSAAEALRTLKRRGVRELVMLTGDRAEAAETVAAELGIDRVCSSLLPEDKLRKLEELLAELKPGEKLAFAGDGINDAPVLTRADVGIAMGALGADAAVEAADVVLMDDDPAKIVKAIAIASKCMRIVYENIFFAIGVKLLCLVLGALGLAGMWAAIFADVGVMVLAVLNALRALNTKRI